MPMSHDIAKVRMPVVLVLLGSLLWILSASALLVEADTYRYVCAVLAVIGLVYYLRMPDRPPTNPLGWLCMAWGAYVAVWYLAVYFSTHPHVVGASEWLYAFPFFFPILGVTFTIYSRYMDRIIAVFFAVTLVMLAVTVSLHLKEILSGATIRPLIMNNQIHGAVACGMIVIFSSLWLLHYLTEPSADRRIARFAAIVTPLILILCAIAIYGAKSKGVWLALVFTLPLLGIVALRFLRMKAGILIVGCLAVVLLAGIYAVRSNLVQTAGPTFASASVMIDEITGGGSVAQIVSGTISSDKTPVSMDERLQLWSNGWEVFSGAPIFGRGSLWLARWETTRYAGVPYTLLHNGYLEMLVRYGLFGAVVMSAILVSFIVSVRRAGKAGLIPRAAMYAYLVGIFFFSLTLLSNSNNRLAIGESFALVSSAFACSCSMRLQQRASSQSGVANAAAVAAGE